MVADWPNKRICISVRDNGIGIAPDELPGVFDMFVQTRTGEDRRDGGMGIGLALVRRIAELHGGTAHVASDGGGHGSIFTVELPLIRES